MAETSQPASDRLIARRADNAHRFVSVSKTLVRARSVTPAFRLSIRVKVDLFHTHKSIVLLGDLLGGFVFREGVTG
jgi:hypothetical protein